MWYNVYGFESRCILWSDECEGIQERRSETNLKVLVFDASIRGEKYEASTPD